jgi:hypothetical protein
MRFLQGRQGRVVHIPDVNFIEHHTFSFTFGRVCGMLRPGPMPEANRSKVWELARQALESLCAAFGSLGMLSA